MANIGYQGSDINAPLGALAAQLRAAADAILREWSYIQKLGVPGLEATPYSLDPATAQATFDAYSYLSTVAKIYYGQADQTPAFNFDDALALARGGQ